MSFSTDVKLEIIENRPLRQQHKHSLAYGLFLYSNQYTEKEISIRTRQKEIAEIFCWLASSLLGKGTSTKLSELTSSGKAVYRAWLPKIEERRKLIALLKKYHTEVDLARPENSEEVHAFLAGVFLACGSITNPQKSYHIELVVRKHERAKELSQLLQEHFAAFRSTVRRNAIVLYCKEVAMIQDLLTMMGASRASLAVIDIEMMKNLRNTVNRQTNCETANISKQVSASTSQIMDIELIMDKKGLDSLSPTLEETARLRLNHPEASLRELIELSPTELSRSGLHHRLASLTKMAEEIREDNRRKEKANV